jgi:hypothetical protein
MLRLLRVAVLLAAVAATLATRSASAHAEFVTADPAPGAALTTAPTQVRIVFTQAIARSSTIVVTGPDGRVVSGATTVSGNVATVSVQATAPGVYQVQWANTSLEDGHERSGAFQFTVVAARPPAVPGLPAQAAPPATMPRTGTGPAESAAPSAVSASLVGAIALIPAVTRLLLRRRRYGHKG